MSIGFGIIGLGNRGYKYALHTIMKSKECHIEMVCDAHGNHFDQFPGISNTKEFTEVLENPKVDAVFIATPDDTHAEIVIQAAKHKKHILCEKPLEISREKVQEIQVALRDFEGAFEVGYVLRYARLFQKVKSYLISGAIGDLHMINVMDHIPYGGYAYFHDWHRKRETSTSLLLQKATHSLDIVNWYVDAKPREIAAFGRLSTMGKPGALKKFGKEVASDLHCRTCVISDSCEESIQNILKEKKISWSENWPDSCVFNSEIDVDDHQTVMVQYENGTQLAYQLCLFGAYYKREFHIFGSGGELRFDDVSNEITIYDRLRNETVTYKNDYAEEQMEPGDEEQLQDFILAVQTGKKPISNLESSITAALLAIDAQASIDQKKMIKSD
ncbi:Gfo/Idh/MocA family oxidoreductase [Enterococcus sp. 669A]|uniref:Gfo/Idh/MocA family oxidoreductase n=1 Tax=Candidatus Enterococcus moelleringii TaxID=2815325 RepID=A0ABS3L558_9ENTE|nr:Gfo/Idh/MocA family oxidoreductase [Enterococcus sp. 669A]MBO1304733.1 Gfo/Idh/MocA family oxidoreductase [Enterococcus sp. 669A]